MLVHVIRVTGLESKLHRLSVEAFHHKYAAGLKTNRPGIQKQLLSFLEIIDKSTLQTAKLERFGSEYDGGYVVYSEIHKDTSVISCGIGNDASFDFAIAHSAKNVYMFDHTISTVSDLKLNMHFYRLGINNYTHGFFVSLPDIVKNNKIDKCVLKMDIEGMEWEILDSLELEFLNRFDQIIVEFHDLFKIASESQGSLYLNVINKLVAGFNIVNVHPNNWGEFRIFCGVPFVNTLEVTCLNKAIEVGSELNPINRNHQNNPADPEYILFRNPKRF